MEKFEQVSANPQNPKWKQMIKRENKIYKREYDLRSEFERDTDRITHSDGYKRLKHKTQVFFSPTSDHICTRIEHVNHVENISYTIAKNLGLNTELTKAIALGHDIGHSPFGHEGEKVLSRISQRELDGEKFWHEKNGLEFVDNIELLENPEGYKQNLNLTYAVRDGIISHCGEVDENSLFPRQEAIDLHDYTMPNQYPPYTWEGCVIKIVDKISYIGRDIEDAIRLKILNPKDMDELNKILYTADNKLNNTNIISNLVNDICANSSIEKGIRFSEEKLHMINTIKKFNTKRIYQNERIIPSTKYFSLVIEQIYETLSKTYSTNIEESLAESEQIYPSLIKGFKGWIEEYSNILDRSEKKNKMLYDINNEKDYKRAIIEYIAGMTDKFALDSYEEIISF